MPNLVGIGNSQVPTNAMLGGLAYQDSVGEIDIEKIKARVSDTATDIFVYDTSKDSDGGAWRKRTQHTSWYNEPSAGISSFRGSRKEFPAVAVIVAEESPAYKVTIYDGDDPNLSLWMQWIYKTNDPFLDYSSPGSHHLGNYAPKSLSAMNGIVCVGTLRASGELSNLNAGLREFRFIEDACYATNNDKRVKFLTNIADRNVVTTSYVQSSVETIKSVNVNDVAMGVLPNAPISPVTGLPEPIIAVACDTGISVINYVSDDNANSGGGGGGISDGTVRINDIVATTSGYTRAEEVEICDDTLYTLSTAGGQGIIYSFQLPLTKDTSGGTFTGYYGVVFLSGIQSGITTAGDTSILVKNNKDLAIKTSTELLLMSPAYNEGDGSPNNYFTDASDRSIAGIGTDYNSGWQVGNVAVALLSSTDTTTVTGTNLYLDNFSNNDKGWGFADNGSDGIASGVMTIANNTSARATDPNALTGVATGTKLSVSYTVTFGGSGTLTLDDDGAGAGVGGNTNIIQSTASGSETQKVSTIYTKTASDRFRFIRTSGGNFTIDDLVVRILPEQDRSVNNNGIAVYGSIVKEPVATRSDLVYYRNFSDSNYLYQPYNSHLDFGTGDLYIMFWAYFTQDDAYDDLIHRRAHNGSAYTGNGWFIQMGNNNNITLKDSATGQSRAALDGDHGFGFWQHICFVRSDLRGFSYKNGRKTDNEYNWTENLTNTNAVLTIGRATISGGGDSDKTRLALVRMGEGAPSPAQILKIYEDEKHLFAENAKCTLYGTTNDVKAIGYDNYNDILHAGTSSGRSEFNRLNRINNTTTAVTTAISASNGLVAEQ